jgi:NarL family two-component system response regulator LiaR
LHVQVAEPTPRVVQSARAVRVIIADDDPFVRRLIKDALQSAGIVVIAEATTGREAVELTLHYHPDVALIDVSMPGVDGFAATRRIVAQSPRQIVILLTGPEDEEVALLGLRAGASGFLSKDLPVEALPRALKAAARGEAAVSRALTARLIAHLRRLPERRPEMRPVRSPLTNREWEVVGRLAEHRSNADIAAELAVSPATVRSHMKSIRRKLGVQSRENTVEVAEQLRRGWE